MAENGQTAKDLITTLARLALRSFLDTGCSLQCAPASPPRVSVVMLLCNRAELTLTAVQSLLTSAQKVPLELIFVDNGSTDETGLLLERLEGIKAILNNFNVGFPAGVNQGARLATGEFVLLLNNDTQVLGDSIGVGVSYLDANPDVGAVGGRIILLDGTLQEAGCSLFVDGWTVQQGRGRPPDDPAFSFQRDVDYCSGAFLLTRRASFWELGGLDETFSPGYFEDADYGMRVWEAGRRVVYLPDIAVLHYENATSSVLHHIPDLVGRNHALFAGKHAAWLPARLPRAGWSLLAARSAPDVATRVLLVADGFFGGRSVNGAATLAQVAHHLLDRDAFLTLCHTRACRDHLVSVLRSLPRTAEVLPCESLEEIGRVMDTRRSYYDLLIAGDAAAKPVMLPQPACGPVHAVWTSGRLAPWRPGSGCH